MVSGVVAPIRLAPGEALPGKTLRGAEGVCWESKEGKLVLRAAVPGAMMPTHEIFLPGWPRGLAAHLCVTAEARGIQHGAADWQDGRMLFLWRQEDGTVSQKHLGLLGAKGSVRYQFEYVAVLDQPGQPSIFLQHAGSAGEFEIQALEMTPVGLRPWVPWATGAMLLLAGLWWSFLLRRLTGQTGIWRPGAAAALGLLAVWTLILPGPWEPLRPLGAGFSIGPAAGIGATLPETATAQTTKIEPSSSATTPTSPNPSTGGEMAGPFPSKPTTTEATARAEIPTASGAIVASAELPVPGALDGGWFSQTYRWVKKKARALMHFGVFAGLTLAFTGLLQSFRGWIPVALVGAGSEAMQTTFGFGFGWEDAADLVVNGLGIACGLLVWRWWRIRRRGQSLTSLPCP